MSCALSQKLSPDIPWYQRILIGFDITDELFAISIARPNYLNPSITLVLCSSLCHVGLAVQLLELL